MSRYSYLYTVSFVWLLLPVFILSLGSLYGVTLDSDVMTTTEWVDIFKSEISATFDTIPIFGGIISSFFNGIIDFFMLVFGGIITLFIDSVAYLSAIIDSLSSGFGIPVWLITLFLLIWVFIPFLIIIVELIIPLLQGALT